MALIDGLQTWRELDEASGIRVDSHTNGADLSDVNTVGSMAGLGGSLAADFVQADNEYLLSTSPFDETQDQWTVAFWGYNLGNASAANIIGRFTGAASVKEWVVYNVGTTIYFRTHKADGSLLGDTPAVSPVHNLASPGWNLVILEFNVAANRKAIYVDNDAGGSSAFPSQRKSGASTDFRAGGGMGSPFDGGMSTIATWNRALSTAERTLVWNGGARLFYSDIAAQPPDAPTLLTATATAGTKIALAWVDNSDDETGFKVERSLDGATGWTLINTTAANATTYTDTSLTPGVEYFYRVAATNAEGDSAYTNIESATTHSGPVTSTFAQKLVTSTFTKKEVTSTFVQKKVLSTFTRR